MKGGIYVKQKLLCLICSLALLITPFNSFAAEQLVLSKPNFSKTWTGSNCEITIPYSGAYTLTVAGSQGGTYNATRNGGTKVVKSVWLNKGDVITFDAGVLSKDYNLSNRTISVLGGEKSLLYHNNSLIVTAMGGSATSGTNATADVDYVEVYNSDNVSQVKSPVHHHHTNTGLSSGTLYASSNPGGCYVAGGHTHDAVVACPKTAVYKHACDGGCGGGWETVYFSDGCAHCNAADGTEYNEGAACRGHEQYVSWHSDNQVFSHWNYTCGSPTNTWKIGCGYSQHQIVPVPTIATTNSSGGTVTTNSNKGQGYFTIQLNPCNNLYNSNVKVMSAYYDNYPYNVIINNDTVVYCKHGTLN